MALERKEKQLLQECKTMLKKGDVTSARLIASQVAKYRKIHSRNLEGAILIDTKSQAMLSDHKVNTAAVESVKGWTYANQFESFSRVEDREKRLMWRSGAIDALEGSMREHVDDVITQSGDRFSVDDKLAAQDKAGLLEEVEIGHILQQATGTVKGRIYLNEQQGQQEDFIINIKSLENPRALGTRLNLTAPGTDYNSIGGLFTPENANFDFIKRILVKDSFAVSQLNLVHPVTGIVRPFELGKLVTVDDESDEIEFMPIDVSYTLKSINVKSGSTLFVRNITTHEGSSGGDGTERERNDEDLLYERIQNVRL
jgi:hypothetical protein